MEREHKIRGHHLIDIADYLHEDQRLRQHYLNKGYGEDFVNNQAQIFDDFIAGRSKIKLIAGQLDDTCLGNCQRRDNGVEIPCEDTIGIKVDTQAAGCFFLEIGKSYSFKEIERNLRNFYLDQHSI